MSSRPDERPLQRPDWAWLFLVLWPFAGSFLSGYVWLYSIGEEPHYGKIKLFSVLLILAGGNMTILLWVLWSLVLIFGVVRRRFSPFTLPLLLISPFFLMVCLDAITFYLNDRATWSQMQSGQL